MGDHTAPIWGIWHHETLYFSTSRASRKGRNLTANPEVVIHLESGDEAVILEGRVEEFDGDPGVFDPFAEAYDAKYPGFGPKYDPENVFYRVVPRVALAWIESEFPASCTRWTF